MFRTDHATERPPVPASLGIGPMSRNAVDAAISVAYRRGIPLMLIASRRQVDTSRHGGGYVESWDTAAFASYVRARDPEHLILLCRDHGGPYQSPREKAHQFTPDEAMTSAAESFHDDLSEGFDLLHIDTSVDRDGPATFDDAVERAIELCATVTEFAHRTGRRPRYEFGFEDQGLDTNRPTEFAQQLDVVLNGLKDNALPTPTFVVAQTATKVLETANVGALTVAPAATETAIADLAHTTHRRGIALKAHNCDYLTSDQLALLRDAGVDAINVAPEYGVAETRALIAVLRELGMNVQLEHFLAEAYDSGAWRKWMAHDTTTSDTDRAVIAGHYVFATEPVRAITDAARTRAAHRDIELDHVLREAVTAAIDRHLTAFAGSPLPIAAAG